MTTDSTDGLPRIVPRRLTGNEPFSQEGREQPFNVLSFWQWYGSGLMDNTLRGVLAEFIVASALDIAQGIRVEWDAFDLVSPAGSKIEVKSAAYCQAWEQKVHSKVGFGVRTTQPVNPQTNTYQGEATRPADLYVFALLHHQDKATVNPLCLDQWTFYVVSREHLDATLGTQKSVGLARLEQIAPAPVGYSELCAAIRATEATLGFVDTD